MGMPLVNSKRVLQKHPGIFLSLTLGLILLSVQDLAAQHSSRDSVSGHLYPRSNVYIFAGIMDNVGTPNAPLAYDPVQNMSNQTVSPFSMKENTGFDAGLGFSTRIAERKRLSLQLGLNWENFQYTGIITRDLVKTTDYSSGDITYSYQPDNRSYFYHESLVSLPLTIAYRLNHDDRRYIGVKAGGTFGMIFRETHSGYADDGNSAVGLYTFASCGIIYTIPLSDRNGITVEPVFNYQISKGNSGRSFMSSLIKIGFCFGKYYQSDF